MKAHTLWASDTTVSRFNRLSASLHVKAGYFGPVTKTGVPFQSPFGITACERGVRNDSLFRIGWFQSPFGITACERPVVRSKIRYDPEFQSPFGITACESGLPVRIVETNQRFQSPFGITACESHYRCGFPRSRNSVSIAFRHHCM